MKIKLTESYHGEIHEPGKIDKAVSELYKLFQKAGGDRIIPGAPSDSGGEVDALLDLEAVMMESYVDMLAVLEKEIVLASKKR